MDFPKTLFVIGTDTGVGKTFVASMLTLGLNAVYWKPVQCGVSPCTDTEWVREATGLSHEHFLEESYRFGKPISPHAQPIEVDLHLLKPSSFPPDRHLIIEGSGGIMLPLNEKEFFVDFIKELGAPTLLVVRNTKGAINQAILSVEKLTSMGIPIFAIALNGKKDKVNREAIKRYCNPARLFEIDIIPNITKTSLKQAFEMTINEPLFSI